MKPLQLHRKVFSFLLLILLFSACNREQIEPQEKCEQEVSYTNDVKEIIDASCAFSGCHINGSAPGEFSSYQGLQTYLDNDLFRSRVLVIQNMPPAGVDQLTEQELELLTCWATGDYIE